MIKKTLAIFFLCLPVISYAAEEASSSGSTLEAGRSNFFAHVGIDIARNNAVNPSSVSYTLGGKYAYFFKPKVGVFAGLDYVDRTYSVGSTKLTMPTVDVPAGIVFNYAGHGFADEGALFLGLAYQIPAGFKYTGASNTQIDGKGALALYLGSATYFEVSNNFLLGLVVDIKIGLGDSLGDTPATDAGRTTDVMIGLGAKFN